MTPKKILQKDSPKKSSKKNPPKKSSKKIQINLEKIQKTSKQFFSERIPKILKISNSLHRT